MNDIGKDFVFRKYMGKEYKSGWDTVDRVKPEFDDTFKIYFDLSREWWKNERNSQ